MTDEIKEPKQTLRTISEEELKDILEKHKLWLADKSQAARADLRSADLRSADLRSADLSSADLSSANLSSANLRYADLSSANLSSANLSSADLRYADLVIFQFRKDTAYFTFDGCLRIGCTIMTIEEWVLAYEEIGKKHGYSDQEIMIYGDFIKTCLKLFRGLK